MTMLERNEIAFFFRPLSSTWIPVLTGSANDALSMAAFLPSCLQQSVAVRSRVVWTKRHITDCVAAILCPTVAECKGPMAQPR